MVHRASLLCCVLYTVAFSSAQESPVGFSVQSGCSTGSPIASTGTPVVEPPVVTMPPLNTQSAFTFEPSVFINDTVGDNVGDNVSKGVLNSRGATGLSGPVCGAEQFDSNTKPFNDRNHSYCGHIPDVWNGAWHYSCPHCVCEGTSINITCPNDWETCELLINLYVCPGCSSSGAQETHGLWPSSLAGDGWSAASACSPAFCTDNGRHQLVSFHKQVLAGETEVLPETATDPTMYFSIIAIKGRVCDDISDETECNASKMCGWTVGGECIAQWCTPSGPGGQNPGCGAACAPGTPTGDCNV